MAIVERYVNDSSAGGGDGTTEALSGANAAWTWSEMLTNLSAGQRANIKGNVLRGVTPDTFSNSGTLASPMWLRFYNSTIGDLDANGTVNGRNADGALDTTNFPMVTCGAGAYTLTFPSYCVVEHGYFDFSSSTANQTVSTGSYCLVRRCYVNSATTFGVFYTGQHCKVDTVDCHNSAASPSVSNSYCFSGNRNVDWYNCRATSDVSTVTGFNMIPSWKATAKKCQTVSIDRPFSVSTVNAEIIDCSARNFGNEFILLNSSTILNVFGCVAWGDGTGKFINDGGSSRGLYIDTNAYGNTGADTITGDYVINQNRITLTADPFTSASDLSLNAAAGGGALCKNASRSGGGQDLGAIQSAEATGGGGRRNRGRIYYG